MSRRKSEKLANGDAEKDVSSEENAEEVENGAENDKDAGSRTSKRAKKEKTPKKGTKESPRKRSASKSLKEESDEESDTEYEVAKIIDVKTTKGKKSFLVNWKGYSNKDNSWEPESNLSCADLIKEFYEANEKKSSPAKKQKVDKASPRGKKKKSKN